MCLRGADTDTDEYAHRNGDGTRYPDTDVYADPNGYAGTDRDSDTHAVSRADTNTHRDGYRESDADGSTPDGNRDSTNIDAHSHTGTADATTGANADTDTADRHTAANINPNPNPANRDANRTARRRRITDRVAGYAVSAVASSRLTRRNIKGRGTTTCTASGHPPIGLANTRRMGSRIGVFETVPLSLGSAGRTALWRFRSCGPV